jgi:hypothetical protein
MTRPLPFGIALFIVWTLLSLKAYDIWFRSPEWVQASSAMASWSLSDADGKPQAAEAAPAGYSTASRLTQPASGASASGTGLRHKLDPVHPEGLTVWEGQRAWSSVPDGLRAEPGTGTLVIEPLAADLLDRLAVRLDGEPLAVVLVISRYDPEREPPAAPRRDAGLERGDRLRAALAERGIPPDRVAVWSRPDAEGFREGRAPMDLLLVDGPELVGLWRGERRTGDRPPGVLSITRRLRFPYGSSALADSVAIAALGNWADALNPWPSVSVEVVGHTCDISSAAFNERLGLARAASVGDWLGRQGLDRARVAVRSEGEERPLADNRTPEGQQANRRVELLIR